MAAGEPMTGNGLQFGHTGGKGPPPMQQSQGGLGQRSFAVGFTTGGLPRGQPIGGSSTTSSTSSLSTNSSASGGHQKPVSSVAPTSVQHQKPSPIYQTSSTKIQPVQPQTLSSTPQGILRDLRGELSPPQSTSTPVGTPDLPLPPSATGHEAPAGGLGKPALPPKPTVPAKPTPPPRQTQHFTPSHGRAGSGEGADVGDLAVGVGRVQPTRASAEHPIAKLTQPVPEDSGGTTPNSGPPPPPPTSEPPHEEPSVPTQTPSSVQQQQQQQQTQQQQQQQQQRRTGGSSGDGLPIIKARPLTIKKQPASEHPKLKASASYGGSTGSTSSSSSGSSSGSGGSSNGVHVSINRRIEMPPAFLFPETEAPPADLVSSTESASPGSTALNSQSSAGDSGQGDGSPSGDGDEEGRPLAPLGEESNHSQPPGGGQSGKGMSEGSKMDVSAAVVDVLNSINMNQQEMGGETGLQHIVRRVKKGNLKAGGGTKGSGGPGSRRVSFDPLALLLDASLEGELELVRKTAAQVSNPSAANDEGITALHNAICAGHLDIVKFLVEFGCDVNAQDSDGWTPLHCAASCNNLAMVRFLVEHGACIFATTLSDHETAAEKCEEDEEGYDGCSEYLYSVQEKLGILNNGCVYAVYDYEAHNADELSFHEGDRLVVLRKGDEWEREWWWSRLNDQEGYAPRNLLGLYPRVQPSRKSE
ncbi:hypothetical protein R5R35_007391 [Gryllus longicercus]|uniref:SH3 domain-containing protein n=1 Tax=Gryllus longicercus TaxID=2509291 RepID=A0AAN9Z5G5_9ORTH